MSKKKRNGSARNVRKKHYTPVGNTLLNDPQATLQAKGLMGIFLSNTDDWEINMKEIISRSKNGRDATYKVVNELIELGYFARITILTEINVFDDMEYIFSDIKEDVIEEIEDLKKWASENNMKLKIEHMTAKEKKKTTKKQPLPENQDTGQNDVDPLPENPVPEIQDTGNADTENQYNNNTNVKKTNNNNTNNKNPNPNPLDSNVYDTLWNSDIPSALKIRIKNLLISNTISLTEEQVLLIDDAYHYQISKGYIDPECLQNETHAINDREFTDTIVAMLKTVKDIRNMRGLIKEWVELAFSYKNDQNYEFNVTGEFKPTIPFYDWLNQRGDDEPSEEPSEDDIPFLG